MNLRRRKILLYSAACILVLAGSQFIPFDPTGHDLEMARNVVAQRTSQAILGTEIRGDCVIIVKTGWINGTLSGDGDDYYLRKIFWHWWIYKRNHWST